MRGFTIQNSINLLEKGGAGGASSAVNVSFDNTGTGLSANNVQNALVEIDGKMPNCKTTIRHLESVTVAASGTADVTIEAIPGTIIGVRGIFNDSGAMFAIPDPGLRISFTNNSTCQFGAYGQSSWSGDVYLLIDYIPTPASLTTSRKTSKKK